LTISNSIETRYSLFRHPALETHFQLIGSDSGDTVVLVPGATLPLAVWDPLVPSLVECGYRVIRYDLPGRGYSSAPGGGFNLPSHVEQIDQLLNGVKIRKPVHIVGLALGALIAASYALEHRERVKSVALIAPDGMATRFSFAEKLVTAPVLGDVLLPAFAEQILLARAPRYSTRADVQEFIRQLMLFALRGRYFRKAVLATLRSFPIHEGEAYYERLAQTGIPTRIVFGKNDQITPANTADRLRVMFGENSIDVMEQVGHLPFVEDPKFVSSLLVAHFRHAR
jgi:pimeloyl-ACP methyl ester carboxylesterase